MKKLLLFIITSFNAFAQIQTYSLERSVTITPQGFFRDYNAVAPAWQLPTDIAIGGLALNKNVSGLYNIAIGNHVLESMSDGMANIAIGQEAMKFSPRTELNIAIGMRALNKNGAWNNLALGNDALAKNYSGTRNIAIGGGASFGNISGSYNISLGNYSLSGSPAGNYNTAIGHAAMSQSASGSDNIAIGNSSLYNNSGNMNMASGHESLYNNRDGSYNVGIGRSTLFNNITGNYSTAIGYQAGQSSTESFNTFVGHNADVAIGGYSNATAIGYGSIVDASNKVRIGNSAVNVIEGQVPWSNPSDRRLKENIKYTNRLGLDFIIKLKTVSYNYIADVTKARHDGFIAQDVEAVMNELNIPFSGLKKSADGNYSLAYSDFVMPLVNAIKEQQTEIEKLKNQNHVLSASIEEIKAELLEIKRQKNKAESK